MKVLLVFVVAVSVISAFSAVCPADSMQYLVLGPGGIHNCSYNLPGTYSIYASITLDTPAKGLEFSLPLGYAEQINVNFDFPVTGDLNTSAYMDFGGCLSGAINIFSMEFVITNPGYSCPGLIRGPTSIPSTQEALPLLTGCDDVPRDIVPPCSAASPELLTPPDSAMAVPLSPELSWSITPGDYCFEGIGLYIFTIEYGTDPDHLSDSINVLDMTEWTLGSLQPGTRYFWRVKVWDDYWQYSGSMINYSEIRTFTTEGPVPVKRVTWGELKDYLKN